MKKFLALILGVVFVMGFAASAFAIHAAIPAETTAVGSLKDVSIRLGGEMRIRGWYEKNIDTGTVTLMPGRPDEVVLPFRLPYDKGSTAWYDQRYRLFLDVKSGDNLSGRLMLESGSAQSDVHVWSTTNTLAGNGAKTSTLDTVLEGWIAYTGSGLLGMPAGIKAGHMPTVIGAGTFYDHRRFGDDAILLYIEPMKGTEINFLMAKLDEGRPFVETYRTCQSLTTGAITNVNPSPLFPSVTGGCPSGTYEVVRETSPLGGTADNTDDTDLYSLMLTHNVDKDTKVGLNYSYINNSDLKMKLQNLGITASTRVPDVGIGIKGTADIQFGDVVEDVKAKGYAVTLGADYKLDPVTLRAGFVYGSGDDDATDDDVKTFITSVGAVIDPNLPTVVYNWRVTTAAGALGTGISNTTAANIGVTLSPIKDLTAHLDYYLLRASKASDSKKIGSELDLKLSYRLAKNLTYSINSGVLFAGDFYDGGTDETKEKNAVVFQHGLTLSF